MSYTDNVDILNLTAIGTPLITGVVAYQDSTTITQVKKSTLQQIHDLFKSLLTKSDVGLGNVDNTSDANKPISTATQTALDSKAAVSHTHAKTEISDTGSWDTSEIPNLDAAKITTGQFPIARLASGIPDGTKFVRDDGTLAVPAGGGETNTASNVGTGGVGVFKQKTGVDLEFKKINAGSAKITVTDDTGNSEVDINVVTGADANSVCIGNDSRLSDARTPLAHATSHKSGGSDSIKLSELAAPDDNITLDATSVLHGLMPKADKSKLDGIESGATADQTNAEIETAYNAQVAVVTQVEAEAGTLTTVRRWTPERVKQAIDALGGGGSTILSVRKTSETQVVNNSTTLVNDDTLFIALATNKTYAIFYSLIHIGGTAADIDITFVGPSGSTGEFATSGLGSFALGSEELISAGGTNRLAHGTGFITTSLTPGNLQLQWAQNVATIIDTKIRIGSFLMVVDIT